MHLQKAFRASSQSERNEIRAAPFWQRAWAALRAPSARAEGVLWLVLVAVTISIPAYLIHLVPVYLWSDDAGSYAGSALRWIHRGEWVTDPRRGPVYSVFLALCVKYLGSFNAVMVVQHGLAASGTLLAMATLRLMAGRAMMVPVFLAGLSYAAYGLPLSLAHLVRNETLLFFFSSITFCAWALAWHRKSLPWLCIAAVACGLVGLTKSFVLAPAAAFLLLSAAMLGTGARARGVHIACCLLAFLLPTFGAHLLERVARHHRPSEPQDGILLYGRTAQFTWLEGGIEPEIKAQIRAEVESYRALGKLDNNIILNHTVVPHLQSIIEARNGTPKDLNQLCRRLALEAIAHHPGAYTMQVLQDLAQLNLNDARRFAAPSLRDLKNAAENLHKPSVSDPLLAVSETTQTLDALYGKKRLFEKYHALLATAWLFRLTPILLGSGLLVFFVFRPPQPGYRLWWIGAASCWFFSEALLCTIGRPIDRYWMPMTPVMFLALGQGLIRLWALADLALARRVAKSAPLSIDATAPSS